MKQVVDSLPFLLSGLLGLVAVGWWGFSKVRAARRRFWSRRKGLLLRPPGHTLAEKLSEHSERVAFPLVALFMGSGIAGAFLWAIGFSIVSLVSNGRFRLEFGARGWSALTSAQQFWPTALCLVFGIIGGAGLIWWGGCKFLAWLREGYRLRMGLRGEQAVADELQLAVRAGYHLFNDIPTDADCNIDHVIVGQGGVFAIETKARSKPDHLDDRDAKAVFDGVSGRSKPASSGQFKTGHG